MSPWKRSDAGVRAGRRRHADYEAACDAVGFVEFCGFAADAWNIRNEDPLAWRALASHVVLTRRSRKPSTDKAQQRAVGAEVISIHRAVHPPLNEPVTHGKRLADCPVCGAALIGDDLGCERCNGRLHYECFWGRVATLAEWQQYIRNVNGGPHEFPTSVVCAQCRPKVKVEPA